MLKIAMTHCIHELSFVRAKIDAQHVVPRLYYIIATKYVLLQVSELNSVSA